MANTSHIHFENWTPDQVVAWLKGLDEAVGQYVQHFHNNGIDGKKLLMLTHSDLEKLSVKKLGHQELVLEAVDLLRAMRYGHDTENLQHSALQLGCKARSLNNMVQASAGENDKNRANISHHDRRRRLSVAVLSAMADLLSTLKTLVSWLDRAPFEGIYDMCLLRNTIVKFGMELVNVSQKDTMLSDVDESIMKSCRMLAEICDDLVMNSKEPLVIQPASLEVATIRKKQPEELGLHISSSYYGIHAISGIKDMSPADLCRKIEKGDEVIQVNSQTVLGWQLKKLVESLREKPKEVILLLKKRPRHISPFGNVPNRKKQFNKQHAQAATLPKTLKKRRSRDGDSKQARPSLQEFSSSGQTSELSVAKDTPDNNTDGNDTDNDVFRSGSESPVQFTLPVGVDPKHRRATVSGGSPTLERPSLVIQDLDPPTRPKSQFVNPAEKEAAIAALSENRLGVAKIWDDKSKEMSELTANERIENFARRISESMKLNSPSPTGESPQDVFLSEDSPETVEPEQKSVEIRRQEFRVTKPTPHVLENPYKEVGRPYSLQKGVVTEVATEVSRKDEPKLMKIKRLDSEGRVIQEDDQTSSPKEKKHVGFTPDCKEEVEEPVSYTHVVVGGVVQKIPVTKSDKFVSESPTVRRRNKPSGRRTNLDRRVSCKDLGKGDCEGWLFKRKMLHRGPLTKNWVKRWCILKNSNLFYYKERDDLKAEGVIHLPAFQVSPAPEISKKKFAFKVHNTGTTFCFASERQDDMSKWMNKMGLAAINFDTSKVVTTGGFIKPEPRSPNIVMGVQNIYYSESEDEGDDGSLSRGHGGSTMSLEKLSLSSQQGGSTNTLAAHPQDLGGSTSTLVAESPESPTSPDHVQLRKQAATFSSSVDPPSGTDDLTGILRAIHHEHLTIDGIDKEKLRKSRITTMDVLNAPSRQKQLEKLKKLQSLQRTLKAKEQEVKEMETCLTHPTHDNIKRFKLEHQN